MSQIRRRQFTTKSGNELLYPDAFMVAFTESAGTSHRIIGNKKISRYVLDGVEYTPSSAVDSVTPTTDGVHILYFWLNANERLGNEVSIKYIRIPAEPEYWHPTFIYSSWSLKYVDFMSETPPTMSKDFGSLHDTRTIYVRVPVGSKSLYETAIAATSTGWKKKVVITETNDFNIDINSLFA